MHEPNNGEILGMATSNTFDLNNPRNTDGYTEDELLALGKKKAVGVYRRENPDQTITEDQVLDHYPEKKLSPMVNRLPGTSCGETSVSAIPLSQVPHPRS